MARPPEPRSYDAVFLSPHFDDVALSCGGTATLAARAGRALVVTVFAGQPIAFLSDFARFQHQRWGTDDTAVDLRRREDVAAMAALGVDYRWWAFPDAIYRGSLYLSDEDLFGEIKAGDEAVVQAVTAAVAELCREVLPRQLYVPLAIGGHVDHRVCLASIGTLGQLAPSIQAYEDFPYLLQDPEFRRAPIPGAVTTAVATVPRARRVTSTCQDITDVLDQRLAAIRAYTSQVPTIFRHVPEWERHLREYAASLGSAPGRFAERFWTLQPEEM
jgi:LmbE family N-acetylglucosaminyl deacetylase